MNTYQTNLYNNLMNLVATNEAFYFQDFKHEDVTYRIFNYRLASYTEFLLPAAIECRGTMFEVKHIQREDFNVAQDGIVTPIVDTVMVRLAAIPMEKFFNLNENPLTMDLDLSLIEEIQEKADGSLMTTYMHGNELRLKSKGSIASEQCIAAMEFLKDPKNRYLRSYLKAWTENNWSINLEWCSPIHRIVLGYPEPSLRVLNARYVIDGHYAETLGALIDYMVERVKTDDKVMFVNAIKTMTGVEGYVVRLQSGQRVKIKCDWYLSLHHAKDSVNNPRRLFEVILDEGIDDVRSMFYDDKGAIALIDAMQQKVDHIYNSMVKEVETFYETNKHLDRKSYAIKGQAEVTPLYFGLVMNKYQGRAIDYKGFLKGEWKRLGFKDESVQEMAVV
jgi:T4 RnlA family RNA ligase